MKLNKLPKLSAHKNKRLGHGYGSGKGGHTSSRGQKGQKSRHGVRMSFTGSSWVWFKRLPFMRGKSRFNSFGKKALINLSKLNLFENGAIVSIESLIASKIISKNQATISNVKIVGTGELKKKLNVMVPATIRAQKAISASGGEYSGRS
ncbi:50S ribosomal protein L15 [Candidatus Collierbacteria bacterium CG10_big_fil_rev_8_21_14_0_10_44_9]|uniref:Large ribosomal subunit protein uL15 n=1 Tax=Candidatus Collierbacteria bacterium CG10_big_fil_rev_8_21_14_0_10_44_9 TaxID=1974535 RepID=A0A2H0VJN1_9BACT|nr:MAG: 50S ribosomal protein L15 [Candidatus Collierbacteria bacterium CG10_big_fil_rev_8_21_14_0_10_44_9]